MATSRRKLRLADAYALPEFRPRASVRGVFGDQKARIITLVRRPKKRLNAAVAGRVSSVGMIARCAACATCPAATRGCTWSSSFAGLIVDTAGK